jgi:hypothetical protein
MGRNMSTWEKTQIEPTNVRPANGLAGLEKAEEAVKKVVEYIHMLYPESQSELELAEDALIVTIKTKGFDWVMLSEIQRIGKAFNVRISFNVEPYDYNFVVLYLVASEASEE